MLKTLGKASGIKPLSCWAAAQVFVIKYRRGQGETKLEVAGAKNLCAPAPGGVAGKRAGIGVAGRSPCPLVLWM